MYECEASSTPPPYFIVSGEEVITPLLSRTRGHANNRALITRLAVIYTWLAKGECPIISNIILVLRIVGFLLSFFKRCFFVQAQYRHDLFSHFLERSITVIETP